MAEIVLDANVLVGYFDSHDTQHARASKLIARLEAEGHESVLLDVLVAEAVSVLCRKAVQRKTSPPDLSGVLARVRHWHAQGDIEPTFQHLPRLFSDVLDVIAASRGVLNFNDGLLVALQRDAVIDDVASFDDGFDVIPDFRRLD